MYTLEQLGIALAEHTPQPGHTTIALHALMTEGTQLSRRPLDLSGDPVNLARHVYMGPSVPYQPMLIDAVALRDIEDFAALDAVMTTLVTPTRADALVPLLILYKSVRIGKYCDQHFRRSLASVLWSVAEWAGYNASSRWARLPPHTEETLRQEAQRTAAATELRRLLDALESPLPRSETLFESRLLARAQELVLGGEAAPPMRYILTQITEVGLGEMTRRHADVAGRACVRAEKRRLWSRAALRKLYAWRFETSADDRLRLEVLRAFVHMQKLPEFELVDAKYALCKSMTALMGVCARLGLLEEADKWHDMLSAVSDPDFVD
jgi:hypothetical protein